MLEIGVLVLGALLVILSLATHKNSDATVSVDVGHGPRTWRRVRKGHYLGFWGWVGSLMILGAAIQLFRGV